MARTWRRRPPAVELAAEGRFECIVALDSPVVKAVPLAEAVAKVKTVPLEHEVVMAAWGMGISFED